MVASRYVAALWSRRSGYACRNSASRIFSALGSWSTKRTLFMGEFSNPFPPAAPSPARFQANPLIKRCVPWSKHREHRTPAVTIRVRKNRATSTNRAPLTARNLPMLSSLFTFTVKFFLHDCTFPRKPLGLCLLTVHQPKKCALILQRLACFAVDLLNRAQHAHSTAPNHSLAIRANFELATAGTFS